MATTALTIATNAFVLLNVYQPAEPIPAEHAAFALTALNNLLGQWALMTGTIPVIGRSVFPLVGGKGGPSAPYSLGIGGDFNVPKPPSVSALTGAALLLGGTSPPQELPRALIGDDAYAAIRIKDLTNPLPTYVYYNATVAQGLGSVSLWPVPSTTFHSLVLYLRQYLTSFPSLTASYDLPLGYDEALMYNLAKRLALPYGRAVSDDLNDLATSSLANLLRANATISDLPIDPMFVPQRPQGHGYNILVGR